MCKRLLPFLRMRFRLHAFVMMRFRLHGAVHSIHFDLDRVEIRLKQKNYCISPATSISVSSESRTLRGGHKLAHVALPQGKQKPLQFASNFPFCLHRVTRRGRHRLAPLALHVQLYFDLRLDADHRSCDRFHGSFGIVSGYWGV